MDRRRFESYPITHFLKHDILAGFRKVVNKSGQNRLASLPCLSILTP
jgi:hypothetical protein